MCKKALKSIAVISLISLMSVGMTSCKKTTGGGWIPIGDGVGNNKATFGFQASCDNIEYPVAGSGLFVGHITGNLQFKDHASGVKLKGSIDYIPFEGNGDPDIGPFVDPGYFTSCEMISEFQMYEDVEETFFVSGSYEPVPKNAGPGGTFSVFVWDGDLVNDCDGFAIFISGGIYDGYSEDDCLNGGNVTVFEDN